MIYFICCHSCYHCIIGKKYFPLPYKDYWYTDFLNAIYKRCRTELAKEGEVRARDYLKTRGLDPEDYANEPIGVIPAGVKVSSWINNAEKFKDEENTRLEAQLKTLDQRNKKEIARLESVILSNNEKIETLRTQLQALENARGWLAFFYIGENGDFVSINVRNPDGEGYKQIKVDRKGIFSPTAACRIPGGFPGDVLVVEGEFNLLTLRKAYRAVPESLELSSVALGSASSWDAETARKYFDGDEFCVNYDNDEPGREAALGLAESGTLYAFTVPENKDADGYIKVHGLLAYCQEWFKAEKMYRSWNSCG